MTNFTNTENKQRLLMTDLDQEWCMTHNRCQVNCKMNDKQIQKLKNQGGKSEPK